MSISDTTIALLYAVAIGAGWLTNLVFGRLFDRIGFPFAAAAFLLGAAFAPFVFSRAILAQPAWNGALGRIGMGPQTSLLKAMLASVITASKRSTGFGLFLYRLGRGLVSWQRRDGLFR